MRFLKEVVYLKVTDVNSFLVVKETWMYVFNRKKGPKDGEMKKYSLRPRDIIRDVQINKSKM